VFADPLFAAELLRSLGYVSFGGADVGECLATARRIRDGDAAGWHAEWTATADRVYALAEASLTAGHPVSAREAYLRAATYYRSAWRFLVGVPPDPRVEAGWERQAEAFREAATLFPVPVEPVAIPYRDTRLPGYFYRGGDAGEPRPTLIAGGGYDGTCEESYFEGVVAALARGYSCLCFDGPGQGRALIKQGLFFRPDWEVVIAPVVDYLLTRPEVDGGRIALLGRGWGGYLALRAASGERRLAACIADGALLSPAMSRMALVPRAYRRALDTGDPDVLDAVIDRRMRDAGASYLLHRGMWAHGVATPLAYLRTLAAYTLDGIVARITCPTLICEGEQDRRAGPGRALYESLTCSKEYLLFRSEDEAGTQALAGARALDWLDEVLARSRGPKPSRGDESVITPVTRA
jgi:pimeloyl-ACP methyl ester carboxylesterase